MLQMCKPPSRSRAMDVIKDLRARGLGPQGKAARGPHVRPCTATLYLSESAMVAAMWPSRGVDGGVWQWILLLVGLQLAGQRPGAAGKGWKWIWLWRSSSSQQGNSVPLAQIWHTTMQESTDKMSIDMLIEASTAEAEAVGAVW